MNKQILSLPSWMKKTLNKLEEAVSENNAYIVAPCKAKKLMSVCRRRAKLARPFRH